MYMTNREAYVLGWVFGFVEKLNGFDSIGGHVEDAAQRPYYGFTKVISAAHTKHIINEESNRQIAEAIDEISYDSEKHIMDFQPLEKQGCWYLGYYAGKAGSPLSKDNFDIAAARKAKGMTQVQLADALGVYQTVISRWENGKAFPNTDHINQLKKVLEL